MSSLLTVTAALERQKELTPVERFARHHDETTARGEPDGARWWRDRIPTQPPTPGTQYGFVVDLDACTGCKACVTACHSLNGLDDGEAWRRIGSLHGAGPSGPVVQTVTTACHHCVEPACLAGCPVDAYDKDPVTGIVAHLDDQCIGCRYCTLTCPYEVPQFHAGLGIVRKCDLCAGRLADGEAPACVQGCPNGAIRVELTPVDELRAVAHAPDARLVPGAPASSLTVPATRYRSRTPLAADLRAASEHSVDPGAAHPSLSLMLVLTQVAVGAFVVATVAAGFGVAMADWVHVMAFVTGVVALGASVLHLGRPRLAWRAVLGVGHSWLSREIVAFGLFAGAAAVASVARVVGAPEAVATVAERSAAVIGVVAVVCSAVLYVVTGRTWWRAPTTATRFAVTAVGGGGAMVVVAIVAAPAPAAPWAALSVGSVVAGACAIAVLQMLWWRRPGAAAPDLDATATLLRGPLARPATARVLLAGTGAAAVLLACLAASTAPGSVVSAVMAVAAVGLVVAGELVERHLFFVASAPPRMPGVL